MEAADRLDLSADRGLSEAWDRHAAELYGYAVRVLRDHDEADEALQETFVRAWRSAGRYDASRPLRPWLFAILRNVVIDLGRARAVRPGVVVGTPEAGHEPLADVLLSWQVEEALRRIGEQHRRVLVETYLRGRPYAEVAAELGVPEGTIKSRVYYGLKALRNALEEMGYES